MVDIPTELPANSTYTGEMSYNGNTFSVTITSPGTLQVTIKSQQVNIPYGTLLQNADQAQAVHNLEVDGHIFNFTVRRSGANSL